MNDSDLETKEERKNEIKAPKLDDGRIVLSERSAIQFSYPWVMYSGINSSNSEVILANLADPKQPQQLIKLPHPCRLLKFIDSRLTDELTQFNLLVEDGSKEPRYQELCISKKYPFQKLPLGIDKIIDTNKTIESEPLEFNFRPLNWSQGPIYECNFGQTLVHHLLKNFSHDASREERPEIERIFQSGPHLYSRGDSKVKIFSKTMTEQNAQMGLHPGRLFWV